MQPKSILLSKTFWMNVLTGFIALAGQYAGLIPASAQPYIAVVLAIANVILRFLTNQPVTV